MRKIISLGLILLLISYLLFAIDVFAQSSDNPPVQDTSTTIVGKGTGGEEPTPGPEPLPIPECGLLDVVINYRLKHDFGITIKEGPPPNWYKGIALPAENANCTARKGVYKTFAIATQSYKYKNKIMSRPLTVQFFQGDYGGYSGNIDIIQLSDGAKRYNDYPYNSSLFYIPATWITHESGHILQQRDGSLENKFPDLRWLGSDHRSRDTDCYEYRKYQGGIWIIKTYSETADVGSPTRESMAEAIALYIYNHKTTYNEILGKYVSITNFKRDCPDTYAWVKRWIYDPFEFN